MFSMIFTHYSCVVIIFSIRVNLSLHFDLLFWGTSFLSFCVFCVMSFEFDVRITALQHLYIIIVFVSAIWASVILISLDKNVLSVKII